MRTNIARTTAVAATAVLTALSLTACQSDDKDQSAPKPSSSASTTAPATKAPSDAPSTPAADAPQSGGKTKTPAAGSGTDNSDAGTDAGTDVVTAACTGSTTKVTVTHVTRPIQHLLLTATNTGSKACNAYYAPLLRVDEGQSVMAVYEESKPQAVVTLGPGESGYAAIALGAGGRAAKQLEVHFAPRSGEGSTGRPKKLTLPTGTDIDDAGASVTYWQSTLADALTN